MLITGFAVNAVRRRGTLLIEELYPGCAAVEQYSSKAVCGEMSDVYALAATMFYALTGSLPKEAPERLNDQRLLISKEVLKNLPPFAVTAIANALQVKQETRTGGLRQNFLPLRALLQRLNILMRSGVCRPSIWICLKIGGCRPRSG